MKIKGTKFNPFEKADKVILSSDQKAIIKINKFKTKSGLPVESRTIYPNDKKNFENYVVAIAKKNNFDYSEGVSRGKKVLKSKSKSQEVRTRTKK